MYETAGALTIVERGSSLVWLLLLPLLWTVVAALAAVRGKGARVATRVAIAAAGGALGIAIVHAVRAALSSGRHVFEQHVASIARLGQLDLGIDLSRDPTSATFSVVVAFLGLASVLHAVWSDAPGAPARLAWGGLATTGVTLVVLADAWPVLAVGLGLATLGTWSLSGGGRPRALALALGGDVAMIFAACVLFWSLGGEFSGWGYMPDPHPRFALVALPDVVVPDGKAEVQLTTYPDATVTSDDGASLPGEPLRAPFSVIVDPGVRSFRIQAGAAATDLLVTHVTLAAGRSYVLTPYGPTTSSRNAGDQLAVARPTAFGLAPTRAALGTRTLGGLSEAAMIALLAVVAALLRLALLARVDRGGLAHALEVVPPVVLAMRVVPLLDPADGASTALATLPAAAAVLLATEAASSRAIRSVPRGVLAALGAVAVTAVLSGERAAAVMVVVAAASGAAAAIAAVEGDVDVRWLGVASAGLAGLLPLAGTSSGVAAAVSAALTAVAGGRVAGAATAALLVTTVFFVSLAAFRVYGLSIRGGPESTRGPRGPRVLVVILAITSLLGGAALGVGTTAFGGSVAPLARRLVAGKGGGELSPPMAGAGLALVVFSAALGLLAARSATAKREAPGWLAALRAPGSLVERGSGAAARAMGFLSRSVRVLDAEVIDDITDLLASAFARLGARARRVDAAASGAASAALGQAVGHASAKVGLDDPRSRERVRTVLVLALVAILGLVVLSSVVLG